MQAKPVTLQTFYELPRNFFFDSSPAYHLLAPSKCKLRLGVGGYSGSFPAMRPKHLIGHAQRRRLFPSKAHAIATETNQPKWWEKNAGPNMTDIHSTQEFLDALSQAGNRLVVVDFFGTWCASCRALFPKICRIAKQQPEILFLKVNFDENKPLCRSLNIKVLPYFQFYRGADGLLDSFSCSLAKLQKLKDAIALHSKGDDDSHADYSGCASDLSETSTVPEYKFL